MADTTLKFLLLGEDKTASKSLGDVGTAADKTGEKLSKMGSNDALDKLSSGALVAGAALAVGIGVAVKSYADFDEALSQVAATGDDAKANMAELGQVALKAGADTKYSATEAAQGMESLFKAGVSAKDVIGGGLTSALNLAASGNMSVAESADFMATAMKNFNVPGSESARVADAIAAAANKAQGDVSDMAKAMEYVSIPARDAGMSIEQAAGSVAQLAEAGIIGEKAGTSLRGVLMALTAPSKLAQKEIENLGITLYDSQGKWLGYNNAVDQLQTKLGPLSDAERDMALGTIFGNESISAARVLMSGGVKDANDWTAAVTDAGYAQQLAADKMNNLKGDLEQLSGSFETSMIKLGTSSDGPLRSVVQGLTAVVNAAGDAPPELQAAGLALGGVSAAGLLVVGGLGKAVVAINETKLAMTALGITAKTATLSMGAIGIALTVAAAAFGTWASAQADAKAKADDFTSAIKGQTDAVNANSRAVAAKQLQDSGALDAARKLGLSLTTVTDASLGNASAMAVVKAATDAATLSSSQIATAAQNAGGAITGQAQAVGGATTAQIQLSNAATVLSGAIGGTNTAFNTAIMSAKQLEEATANGSAASGDATLAVGAQSAATAGLSAAQQAAKLQADALTQSHRDLGNALLQESGSAMGLESAIDAATQSLKDNKANLDINTEAGRNNRTALDTIASSALALQKAQEATGASTESLNAYTLRARDAFIETATSMGMGATEAANLADKYGLVPKEVTTTVSAPGASTAASQIDAVKAAEDRLYDKTITIRTLIASAQAANNQAAISSLQANGSILKSFAGGGFENHVAQIAPAGAWRVWAEPETGGEAYIPLAQSKRTRSIEIWRQTGRELGVMSRADGGIDGGSGSSGGGYSLADLRAVLDGAQLAITGADAFSDSMSARLVLAIQRRAGVR